MAQWPPPKYALAFSMLQTAKNRSFECIMMQNGNYLLVGDTALSRWEVLLDQQNSNKENEECSCIF